MKKAIKKSTKKKASKREFNLGRFKNMLIVALVAVIIGITSAFVWNMTEMKSKMVTAEQQVYLSVFDELAKNFVQNLDIHENGKTIAKMTDYGVSDEDGAFYIAFDFVVVDDDGKATYGPMDGKVYFWYDTERDAYSYAFSYNHKNE